MDLGSMNAKTSQHIEEILRRFHNIYKLRFKNDGADLDRKTLDALFSGIKAAPNLESIALPAWCAKEKEFYMGALAE